MGEIMQVYSDEQLQLLQLAAKTATTALTELGTVVNGLLQAGPLKDCPHKAQMVEARRALGAIALAAAGASQTIELEQWRI